MSVETCPRCGWRHPASMITAVGRFSPDGTRGYRYPGNPTAWATREEALAEWCRVLAARDATEPDAPQAPQPGELTVDDLLETP